MNIKGRGATEAANCIKTTIPVFTAFKINIQMLVGDNKFESVSKSLRPVQVEIVSDDEHEGHVQRLILTVKGVTRCGFHNIPYKKCPKRMVVSSLEANITWINFYPRKM